MPGLNEAERRQAVEQALASSRIEGHEPTPEFLADCQALIAGAMMADQVRAASLARALSRSSLTAAAAASRERS